MNTLIRLKAIRRCLINRSILLIWVDGEIHAR